MSCFIQGHLGDNSSYICGWTNKNTDLSSIKKYIKLTGQSWGCLLQSHLGDNFLYIASLLLESKNVKKIKFNTVLD